jgi:hypothetical protein
LRNREGGGLVATVTIKDLDQTSIT